MDTFSVAMATYNGSKFIREQLENILNQTVPVSEIIISDDGSTDDTLQIAASFHDDRIHILTDNPRHGCCGNFEHAVKNCTGDYIFLADQDDIWAPDKVEKTAAFLQEHPNAGCIITDGNQIDGSGALLPGRMSDKMPEQSCKLLRKEWLEPSVSAPLANGMCLCISREMAAASMPFPKIHGAHDQWLIFFAVSADCCYYQNEKLVSYRLHGNNTTGQTAVIHSRRERIRKRLEKLRKPRNKSSDRPLLGRAMMERLEKLQLQDTAAYQTAKRVYEIGMKETEAFESKSRLVGAAKLTRLFATDMRYRRSGAHAFLLDLNAMLFH